MNKHINIKIEEHRNKLIDHVEVYINNNTIDELNKNNILNIIKNFPILSLCNDDLQKKRRAKNKIPLYLKCNACRANGEQCSRRKKDDLEYCGTHEKNRPYGEYNNQLGDTYKKVEVWSQDINGILYYIDNNNNVYKTQDIISNIVNPSVIYKYEIDNGVYKILYI
tara:strand:+ start:4010 stop:4507 length:498 start_codon:yes stop_codon:yes gene_type:complete